MPIVSAQTGMILGRKNPKRRRMYMKYKKLFTPVKIGTVEIKNRFAMAPMGASGTFRFRGRF